MEFLDLVQGTTEWLEARKSSFNASEAPAMMNSSKYQTRNQLLDAKKGKVEQHSSATKAIFQKGHDAEELARVITESEFLEDLPNKVGFVMVDGMKLAASFDGLGADFPWEHKLWNATLAENVASSVLEPTYIWQLEHQLLVCGMDKAYFTCSDGTHDKRASMWYESIPERREQLIAGWKQFAIDLEKHELVAKTEVIKAVEPDSLPVINFKVEGSIIVSNIGDCLPAIQERAAAEMSRVLETEQDFADKQKLNVATKAARAKLKEVVDQVKDEFATFADFEKVAAQIDVELQKMQSHGEKQVKDQKAGLKISIITKAGQKLFKFTNDCNSKIAPITVSQIKPDCKPDFEGVMKGKRTIDGWQNAVDSEVSRIESEINEAVNIIIPNLGYIDKHASEYKFLFSDMHTIICTGSEAFQSVVKTRIQDHKDRQAKELEEQREKIRKEEREKAQAEEQAKREAEEKAKTVPELDADNIQICNMDDDYVQATDKTHDKDGFPLVQPEDMPSVSGQKNVITDQVIVEFLQGQLNDVTDFGYLLVSPDPHQNAEAMASLRAKFKVFIGEK